MRKLSNNESVPDGTSLISHESDGTYVYMDADAVVVGLKINESVDAKRYEITQAYEASELDLPVNKHTYKDLQAATLAGVSHKNKTPAATKQAFKDAVLARQTIQEKRDSLLEQIDAATTIEEIELINWDVDE